MLTFYLTQLRQTSNKSMYVSNRHRFARFEVLTAASLKAQFFWDVTLSKGKDFLSFRILFASCHGVTSQRQIFRHRDDKRLK